MKAYETKVTSADLERLLALRHFDAHSIPGVHRVSQGAVLRAFRPDARKVSVIVDGLESWPMAKINDAGLFGSLIPGAEGTHLRPENVGEADFLPIAGSV